MWLLGCILYGKCSVYAIDTKIINQYRQSKRIVLKCPGNSKVLIFGRYFFYYLFIASWVRLSESILCSHKACELSGFEAWKLSQ